LNSHGAGDDARLQTAVVKEDPIRELNDRVDIKILVNKSLG